MIIFIEHDNQLLEFFGPFSPKLRPLVEAMSTFTDHLGKALKFPYDEINQTIVQKVMTDELADVINLDNATRQKLWNQNQNKYKRIIQQRVTNITKIWNQLKKDMTKISNEVNTYIQNNPSKQSKIIQSFGSNDARLKCMALTPKQFTMQLLGVSFLMGRVDFNNGFKYIINRMNNPGILPVDTWRHLMYNY